jgi:hypothetical protein
MNERIKELAALSGMKKCSLGYGMPENVLWGEDQIEKFARLILSECVSLLPYENCHTEKGVHLGWVISEHFGVK